MKSQAAIVALASISLGLGCSATGGDESLTTVTSSRTPDASPQRDATSHQETGSTVDASQQTQPAIPDTSQQQDDASATFFDAGTPDASSPADVATVNVESDCTSMRIDGTSQQARVDIPFSSSLAFIGVPFTIETWVSVASLTGPGNTGNGIVRLSPSGWSPDGYGIGVYPDGSLKLGKGGGGQSSVVVTSAPGAVLPGQWTHLAASFDGTNYRLFVNGSLVATNAGAPLTWSGGSDPIQIGTLGDDAYKCNFDIASFRMSSNARYVTNFVVPPLLTYDSTTLLRYEFAGSPNIVQDLSGHGHDGVAYFGSLSSTRGPSCN